MPMTEPRPTSGGDVTDAQVDETVKLAFEWGHLKLVPRTGWLRGGIERPESVAEHSLRAAMLAWAIAALEGADTDRAATLALFHDSQETRTGDVDYVGRSYLRPASNRRITADQTEALPRALADLLRALVDEYEGRTSAEAECARDADKLEMLLQALDYRQRGHTSMEPFIETAIASLGTRSGRRLAEAAMRADPAAWWRSFQRPVANNDPGDGGWR
jgi:putative hydrolases of HD superfamily